MGFEGNIKIKNISSEVPGNIFNFVLVRGKGKLLISYSGQLISKKLKENERYIVNSPNALFWEEEVKTSITLLGDAESQLKQCERMLVKYTGPGKVFFTA